MITVAEPPDVIGVSDTEPVHGEEGVQPAPTQYCSPWISVGSVSFSVTPVAVPGPEFDTTIV
jgi:hypothetical protein